VVQYLEPGGLEGLDPDEVVAKLDAAFASVRFTDVCLGWRVPANLLRPVVDYVNTRTQASLWRWVPVMTGDGANRLLESDLALGPRGIPPANPGGVEEFEFLCPNRPGALNRAISRVCESLREVRIDGAFLDRVRWASPSQDPFSGLTCFCKACHDVALIDGLDLGLVRKTLAERSATAEGRLSVVAALLGCASPRSVLGQFISWRAEAMTRAVGAVANAAGGEAGRIALDLFSPSLMSSVGQDVCLLQRAEWIKAMTYMSTWAPAGVPYELAGYARWLREAGVAEPERAISKLVRYPIPTLRAGKTSLPHRSFLAEAAMAHRHAGDRATLGIEFVELPVVAPVGDERLRQRVRAAWSSGCGVVASWDLRHIPIDRLLSAGLA
jgi:hypothetical protein